MDRRQFLQTASAGLAAPVFAAAEPEYDREKVRRVGLIGSGWYGKCDLLRLVQVSPVEVASLCDVDSQMLSKAAELVSTRQKSGKQPRTFTDYREMLRQKDLDIVLVATPDHWHALAAIEAIKSGCDVYLQKPIAVDVTESLAILAAARKYKRVVQIGTQRRSTPHLIEARDEIIRAGKLGKISHVEICCYYPSRNAPNPPDSQPPAHLDYEMWTGPAPMRPYNSMVHPQSWRAFMEYGNGTVGDMGIHMYDMARWMLDLGWPLSVSSTGGIYVHKGGKSNISDTQVATFHHPEVEVVWTHRRWGQAPDAKYPWAGIFYGEKGILKASVFSYDFFPAQGQGQPIHKDVGYELEQYPEDKTEVRLEKHCAPAIRGHMKDFLAAIDKRGKPVADVEQGCLSTIGCVLANMSMKLGGRNLVWDAAKGEIAGDPEANRLAARPYRKPWVHPDPKSV
jgi:predicted dehydrogenase